MTNAYARIGSALSGIGDVNGDGYSDVAIGADMCYPFGYDPSNPSTHPAYSGGVYIFYGTPLSGHGLSLYNPSSLTTALNLLVTSPLGVPSGPPMIQVDLTSPIQYDVRYLAQSANIIHNFGSVNILYGHGGALNKLFSTPIANAGDLNGDGYSDMIISGDHYGLGRLYYYYGNSPKNCTSHDVVGIVRNVQQFNNSTGTNPPIQFGNLNDPSGSCSFYVGQNVKCPLGREEVQLVGELKGTGLASSSSSITTTNTPTPFSPSTCSTMNTYVKNSATSYDFYNSVSSATDIPVPLTSYAAPSTTSPSVYIGPLVTLSVSFPSTSYEIYKWRSRIKYLPTKAIDGQLYSKWFYSGIGDKMMRGIRAKHTSTTTCDVTEQIPLADVGPNMTMCTSNSRAIGTSPIPNSACNTNTYSWASGGAGSLTSYLNYTNIAQPTFTPPSSGTFYYTLTETNAAGFSNSNTVTITVITGPVANIGSSSSLTICGGTPTTLGTTAVSGHTYGWTCNPGAIHTTPSSPFWTASTSIVSVDPDYNSAYSNYVFTMSETDPTTGCTASNDVTITVSPTPDAYTGPDWHVCPTSPGTITLGQSTPVLYSTYSWSASPSTAYTYLIPTAPANQPLEGVSSILLPTHFSTITYTLTETNSTTYTTCTSRTRDVKIIPNPLADAGQNVIICSGTSVTLGYAGPSTSTYKWTLSGGVGATLATTSTYTVTPIATTTYRLTETLSGGTCINYNEVTVVVNPIPSANAGSDRNLCSGSTTIGASSTFGNTYSWTSSPSGFTSTSANPSVTPTVNTTYTLVETITATGCAETSYVNVYVQPSAPTLISSPSSAYICKGTATILSSSSCSNYSFVWKKGSTTLPSTGCSISATTAGTYSFTSTYSFPNTLSPSGCSANTSAGATLSLAPDMTITLSGTTLTISSTSTAYYTTYQWFFNGTAISGATGTSFSTTTNGHGYYYAVGTNSSCSASVASNVIKVNIGCGPPLPAPYLAGWTNKGAYTPVASVTINYNAVFASITVNSGITLTLTNADFLMLSCAAITVNPGGALVITNSSLHGCSAWKGIDVKGSSGGGVGSLTMDGDSLQDALIGVLAEKDASISIGHSARNIFKSNNMHIAFNYTSGTATGSALVENNLFLDLVPLTTLNAACSSPISSPNNANTLKMIYINAVTGVVIGTSGKGNTFIGNSYSGVRGLESGVESWAVGLTTQSTNVDYNTFDGYLTNGAYFSLGNAHSFTNNIVGGLTSIPHPLYGLIMNATQGSSIEDNKFYNTGNSDGIGMQFYQNITSASSTTISFNEFSHNQFGLVIAPAQNPVISSISTGTSTFNKPTGSSTNKINVDIHCNAFSSNQVGIIGSGYLADQGSSTTSQENQFFSSGASPYNNVDFDILWREDPYSGTISYFYGSTTGEEPNTNGFVTPVDGKYCLNYGSSSPYSPYVITSSSLSHPNDITIVSGAGHTWNCIGNVGMPSMHKKGDAVEESIDSTVNSNVKFYPNPFTEHFIVEFSNLDLQYRLEVYDQLGRKVLSKRILNTAKIDVDGTGLAPSTYMLIITDNNSKVERYKMVKVKN